MKCLVTGADGFIGSNLSLELEKAGHTVIALSHSGRNAKNLEGFKGTAPRGDIRTFDYDSLGKLDAIFHQAAITDTTVMDEELMYSVNVTAFEKILDFARRTGCPKVVYASSAATYGKGSVPMKEDQVPAPANIYGKSKVVMDKAAREFNKKHPEVSIVGLRYFNVYGPREYHKNKSASMVYQLYSQISSGKPPRVFKWGEQYRDIIYVKDVVKANLCAYTFRGSDIFNVGTAIPTSFNKTIEILNGLLKSNKPTDYFDNPYDFFQEATLADMKLSNNKLKFSPDFPPEKGIADYVKILKQPNP